MIGTILASSRVKTRTASSLSRGMKFSDNPRFPRRRRLSRFSLLFLLLLKNANKIGCIYSFEEKVMLNFVTEYYSKRKLFHIFLPIERAIFECAGKHLETVFAFVTQRLHPIFSFVFSLSGSSSSEHYSRNERSFEIPSIRVFLAFDQRISTLS